MLKNENILKKSRKYSTGLRILKRAYLSEKLQKNILRVVEFT
jgi:hypothetical protein